MDRSRAFLVLLFSIAVIVSGIALVQAARRRDTGWAIAIALGWIAGIGGLLALVYLVTKRDSE